MRRQLLGAFFALIWAVPALAGNAALPLSPVPYALNLPEAITGRLSTGESTGPFAEEVKQAGATASVLVYYQPENGGKTILLAAYYFPADRFDAAQNPDEPPRFGQEVIRKDGMVLSIAGPHDTIYEPDTPDGRNVIAASGLIYTPETYLPK
jgi:hypothetical protein